MRSVPRLSLALLSFAFVPLLVCAPVDNFWVESWACSPQLSEPGKMPPAPALTDATLRQIVHVSTGGTALHVRLSNAFGAQPLTITAVHVALSVNGVDVSGSHPARSIVAFGDSITDGHGATGAGPNALAGFDRDVLAQR